MKKTDTETLADLYEALAGFQKWRGVFKAVLKRTGDAEQARKAVKYCIKIEGEMRDEKSKCS